MASLGCTKIRSLLGLTCTYDLLMAFVRTIVLMLCTYLHAYILAYHMKYALHHRHYNRTVNNIFDDDNGFLNKFSCETASRQRKRVSDESKVRDRATLQTSSISVSVSPMKYLGGRKVS